MEREKLIHPFPPVWEQGSRVLILGTFPSVKSRENAFYYGHSQNRFWPMLAAVYGETAPRTTAEKTDLLLRRRIALWDVIGSCRIAGSSDSSIRDALPNDLPGLLEKCPIRRILLNGKTAERLYRRYWSDLPVPFAALPSTSPANAAWTLQKLVEIWEKQLIFI